MSFHEVVVDCKIYICIYTGAILYQCGSGRAEMGETGNLFSLLGIGLRGYPSPSRLAVALGPLLLWVNKSIFLLWQVKRWPHVLARKKDEAVVSKKKPNARAGYMAQSEIVMWGAH